MPPRRAPDFALLVAEGYPTTHRPASAIPRSVTAVHGPPDAKIFRSVFTAGFASKNLFALSAPPFRE